MAYIDFPGPSNLNTKKNFYLSEEGLALVRQWRREGMSIEAISTRMIDIGGTTLHRWRSESPAFNMAITSGKDIADAMVEDSLLKRALGYDYNEDTWELVEGEMRLVRSTSKHMAPDVKACLSWLFSRRPDRWRATQNNDDVKEDIDKAKKIIVAIKEVADGYPDTAEPETNRVHETPVT